MPYFKSIQKFHTPPNLPLFLDKSGDISSLLGSSTPKKKSDGKKLLEFERYQPSVISEAELERLSPEKRGKASPKKSPQKSDAIRIEEYATFKTGEKN